MHAVCFTTPSSRLACQRQWKHFVRGFSLECTSATQQLTGLPGAVIALFEGVMACSVSHYTQQLIGVPELDSI